MSGTLENGTLTRALNKPPLRDRCRGVLPLDARLAPWMTEVLTRHPDRLFDAVQQYGSPLNVISPEPLVENACELTRVAADRDLDFRIFFARKANKCLAFVDAVAERELGLDVASEQECRQVLDAGVAGSDIICTAAVKTEDLVALCIRERVTMALDNLEELQRVKALAGRMGMPALVAIRVSGFYHQGHKLYSRFGFDVDAIAGDEGLLQQFQNRDVVQVIGMHFHLDGYSAAQRVSGIASCVELIDRLRSCGHDLQFLDMGGGLPVCYLKHRPQWDAFWSAHEEALLGCRPPVTYRNHGLGLICIDGAVHGQAKVYPYYQTQTRGKWLASVLDARYADHSIADALRERSIQLRCEPGRSLLDGCGMTVARVEFTKRHHSGDWFVGLAMNRTQCRTGSDDFLVDPLVISNPKAAERGDRCTAEDAMAGYLVGAYCTESEQILLRKFEFPDGVRVGDLVVLPNTAGYFMHFLESRSHQFPLANNVVFHQTDGSFHIDRIDQ